MPWASTSRHSRTRWTVRAAVKGHGNSSRNPWNPHTRDFRFDSIFNDYSERRAVRPGLEDKMSDTAHDALPSAISASLEGEPEEIIWTLWDSILDHGSLSVSITLRLDDSLFDKINKRSSFAESIFGADPSYMQSHHKTPAVRRASPAERRADPAATPPSRFLSSIQKGMTLMLGGGGVRRCSVASVVDAPPCVRVDAAPPGYSLQFDRIQPPMRESCKSACKGITGTFIARDGKENASPAVPILQTFTRALMVVLPRASQFRR
ncbi:uncharacterized protein BXZ73DRAFT_104921 [Epithele typhae]|uniref:uncharacterized protein n=1 Tax=Epithele typhae TaxID=378194 RepID=UPI002008AFA8|nr:uncharacterized protein BXZ73DRAFT_104921 [Epithele typhae]KAH9919447.1 hypothetical protein BXZ73DRAFT_104921 [Epithele typhae]